MTEGLRLSNPLETEQHQVEDNYAKGLRRAVRKFFDSRER